MYIYAAIEYKLLIYKRLEIRIIPSKNLASYVSCILHVKCLLLYKIVTGADSEAVFGVWILTPLQKYIKEAKRVMYWYKNTLKCIIS